jgi:hypothetical protein
VNRLIDWFARNHVAANLLAAIVVITGLVAMGPRLLLPDCCSSGWFPWRDCFCMSC